LNGRSAALPALALLAAGWALTLWVMPWSDERVSDLFVYRTFAEPFLSGAVPYRDIAFEYPPLAAPMIGLPGVAGTGEEAFRWAYATWTLMCAALLVLLCGALARATRGDPRRAMLAAAAMPLLCGALLRTHFDLFPVALLLGALLLLVRERPRAGLLVLGVGVMTKAFPLVAVPVALAWLVARGRTREACLGALACLAVMGAVAAVVVVASPAGAWDAVEYHLERPVQIESTPAMVLLGLDALGLGDAASVSSHRSDGLEHPIADVVASLFGTAFVALVALLCVLVAGAGRRGEAGAGRSAGARGERSRRSLVLSALAAVVAFAALGKVLSPQFVIWAVPLGALALAWRMHALAAAVAFAVLLTFVEFPAHYFDVVAREPAAIALVAARNLVLLGVVALAVRELQLGRQQHLLDGPRPAVVVGVDH
jgi:hypothetical protein